MKYTVRRTPFGPPTTWRLDGGVLTEQGRKTRHWPLADLRSVRILRTNTRRSADTRVLRLTFGARTVSIGSHSLTGRLTITDQTQVFAAFARAVCEQAAHHAPRARFEAGGARIGGIFAGAVAIFGVGLVLVLAATITAGAFTLGLELATRLAFVLILMLAAWPWIGELDRRSFDPKAVPRELLP